MDNADKFAWRFLLDHGHVVGEWRYYAGDFEKHPKKTTKCHELIKEVGVDWKKTRPVEDSMRSEFAGTFADSSYVKVMYGTLILNDGSTWQWGTSDVDPTEIIRLMAEYLPDPFGDNNALDTTK